MKKPENGAVTGSKENLPRNARCAVAIVRVTWIAVAVLLATSSLHALSASRRDCTRTAHMQVYSNAVQSQETGDLSGFELAIGTSKDPSVNALLYVYEGAPIGDGIPITGHLMGKALLMQGEWVEHLIEYPSKKEIVEKHQVKIKGTLNSVSFRGTVTIEGMGGPITVLLKRVRRVWLCKPKQP